MWIRCVRSLWLTTSDIIAKGCCLVFEDAGMPWSVCWYASLRDVEWPDGRVLVILDLRLEDGSTPTQNLREIERRGLPVIAYTSAESPILVREAIAGGVLAIVRKSGPSSDLVRAIQDALDGRPSASLDWAAGAGCRRGLRRRLPGTNRGRRPGALCGGGEV